MSTMRCCRAWKRAIGWPNCLRVFAYSSVAAFKRLHRADRLRAQQRDAVVGDCFERSARRACFAEQRARGASRR